MQRLHGDGAGGAVSLDPLPTRARIEGVPGTAPPAPPAPPARRRLREPTWEEVDAFIEEHPQGASLEEIAEVFQSQRERIRIIESSALKKLRLPQRRREVE